jgi:excisionase family DNA binding protein
MLREVACGIRRTRMAERDEVVTPGEVAQRLHLGLRSVYAGLEAGQLPGHRVGRKWIIPRVAFEAWLASAGRAHPTEGARAAA